MTDAFIEGATTPMRAVAEAISAEMRGAST
jgi:hypothetical protein